MSWLPEGEPVGGEVTVVTTLAVALYYLPPRLEVFTRRFPMVRMRIEVARIRRHVRADHERQR